MQELINQLDFIDNQPESINNNIALLSTNNVRHIINGLKLFEKEKEQIIDAYYGKIDGVFGYREEGQDYYNQTYNQNK